MQMSLKMFSTCRMLSLLLQLLLPLALPKRELKRTPCDVTRGVAVPSPLPNMWNFQQSIILAGDYKQQAKYAVFFFVMYFLDNKPLKLHCTHEPNKTIFLPCSGEQCGPEWADPGGGGVTAQGHAHGRGGGAAGSTAGGHLPSSRSGTFVVSPPSSPSSRSFSPSLRPVNTLLHHVPLPPPLHPPPPSPLPPLPHHPCMVECRLYVCVCVCVLPLSQSHKKRNK